MPLPYILQDIREHIKRLLSRIPKRWRHQFEFGMQAFGLRAFSSANGNARQVVVNRNTASTKVDRLLANQGLATEMGSLFDSLYALRPSSYVNVDHSDFNGLATLMGAVQTGRGRAIPCMVEATYSDSIPALPDAPARTRTLRVGRRQERAQLAKTTHTIESLQRLRARLGFWPRFVFDRGFESRRLVCTLASAKATFYLRFKAGHLVEVCGRRVAASLLGSPDTRVQLYSHSLRIVRSHTPESGEPWYILTSDLTNSADHVLKVYRHRFEIEETFRDIKHVFGMVKPRFLKPLSLKVVLWLVSLGIALFYLSMPETVLTYRRGNPKKRCSWLKRAYEQWEQAQMALLWRGPPV